MRVVAGCFKFPIMITYLAYNTLHTLINTVTLGVVTQEDIV